MAVRVQIPPRVPIFFSPFPMACVYILYSRALDRFYIGSCKEFDSRLSQHLNKVHKGFTSRADDWEPYVVIGYTMPATTNFGA